MIYLIAIISIVVGVALDQYTKYLATIHLKNDPIVLIEKVFQLQYLENRGAAFGMLQNQRLFFLIITIVTLCIIGVVFIRLPRTKRFMPLQICLISITAGAIGNMIDRIRYGYVVDFFYFEFIDFPIFNVADIFATVATFTLIILLLFYYKDKDIDVIFQIFRFQKKEKKG